MNKYFCPMHKEIVANKPGRCSICGMDLVDSINEIKESENSLGNYLPLIVIFAILIVSSLIITLRTNISIEDLILNFMTGFFLVFSMFKLIDLKGFAQGYSTYDLLAGKFFNYGYIYPFIELAFGLIMLAGYHADLLLIVEFLVMAFSGFGVINKMRKKEVVKCVCLGTVLKAPLTTVTLVEDFGMAFLALFLILI